MKKRLITVICLILALLSFASCSQPEPDPTGLAAMSKDEVEDYFKNIFDKDDHDVDLLPADLYPAAGVTEEECEYVLVITLKSGADKLDFIYAFKTAKQAQAFFSNIPDGKGKIAGRMVYYDKGLGEAAQYFN